jgi:hypothetical protein
MGALDLTGADTTGIAPMPSGKYPVSVYEASMTETKGREGAKLPAGTPMLKIQWSVLAPEEYSNRYLFSNFPTEFPADYDKGKVAKMKGNLVNFLVAVGYEEKDVMSGKYKLDLDDLHGREATAVVSIGKDHLGEPNNELRGLKPAGEAGDSSSSDVL